jgi:hypothetical protein
MELQEPKEEEKQAVKIEKDENLNINVDDILEKLL